MTVIQNLARAAGDAFDMLDAAVMDVECDELDSGERYAFDEICDAKNALERACAMFDEVGTLPAVSTREGA